MKKTVVYNARNTRRHQIFAATSVIALIAAGGASAQTTPAPASAPIQEIVVTGTQIRGVGAVGSPLTVLNRNEIDQSGLVNTGDILHDLPQVTSLGAGVIFNGNNQNASLDTSRDDAVNIRGLQPQATLVLLDGRRTPIGGSTGQLYDPSSIPTIALSGIDLLTGGASATYGSDAVAGVVNLTLRKNFDGLEADGTYGIGTGYHTDKLGAIFGKKWDGGSIMIAAETSYSTELLASQRSSLYSCTPNGITTCAVTYPTNGNVVFNNSTAYYRTPVGNTGLGTQAQLIAGANTYNLAQDAAILPKSNRDSLVWNIQQDLTSKIHLWTEGYFTNHKNTFDQGQLSITGTTVGVNNPGYIALPAGATSEKAYTSLDGYVGPIIRTGLERAYQVAAGADVTLPRDWAFNIYGEHNYNYERANTAGLNSTTTPQALACASLTLCFDPFGPNAVNTIGLPQIVGEQYTNYWQIEDVVNAKFDGPVFSLPGGEVKLAVGGEIQHNTLQVLSQNTIASPTTSVLHIAANFTSPRTIDSVFAEAVIPIIGDGNRLPLVQSFVIDAAGRFDHYSDVGNTSNPKVSFNWKPISDLSIHGQYGTSFRAPTLCDTNPGCTGTVQSSATTYAGYDALIILGGNTAVKPETATTIDFGATYKPSQIHGLTASLDYYSIDYLGVISTPGSGLSPANFAANTIYAPVINKTPTAAYIAYLQAQPWYVAPTAFSIVPGTTTGSNGLPISVINGERFNSGAIHTHGIDFVTDYRWENGLGRWSAGISGTYLINYNYTVFPGAVSVSEANKINYPTRWRFRAKASWSADDLTLVGYVNYTGAYENNTGVTLTPTNLVTNGAIAYTAPANSTVNSFVTLDLTALYKIPQTHALAGFANDTTLSITALNVTNAKPPYALTSSTQEYDAQAASPLGRVINLTVRKAF